MVYNFPKIDLHCHIDGSLSLDFIKSHLGSELFDLHISDDELYSRISTDSDCANLAEYLQCFDLPIKCLQNKSSIKDAVIDVIENAHKEDVKYIELRFAPSFSVNSNLNYNDVFESAINGCKVGFEKFNVHSNIIACCMRHLDFDTNFKMIKSARNYLGDGVCAIDLAGDEASYSNSIFYDLFKEAKNLDFPFTIHSGECNSYSNIETAISFGAKRIGHGIAMMNNLDLIKECSRLGIGIEMCPVSNFQTKAITNMSNYPLKLFLDNNVLATINTDNRTVSKTSLDYEYKTLKEMTSITDDDLKICAKNSIQTSFANDDTKHELWKIIT